MANATQAADVAVDGHVVGRIGENDVRGLLAHESSVARQLERVGAKDPVRTMPPEIAEAGHRGPRPVDWSDRVFEVRLLRAFDDEIDCRQFKAGDRHVEVNDDLG